MFYTFQQSLDIKLSHQINPTFHELDKKIKLSKHAGHGCPRPVGTRPDFGSLGLQNRVTASLLFKIQVIKRVDILFDKVLN